MDYVCVVIHSGWGGNFAVESVAAFAWNQWQLSRGIRTAVQKQLNQMALDEDSSVQALLREALNDLFAKRGKPTIA